MFTSLLLQAITNAIIINLLQDVWKRESTVLAKFTSHFYVNDGLRIERIPMKFMRYGFPECIIFCSHPFSKIHQRWWSPREKDFSHVPDYPPIVWVFLLVIAVAEVLIGGLISGDKIKVENTKSTNEPDSNKAIYY